MDAELIILCRHMWQRLAILPRTSLQINSLGTLEARQRFRTALVEYFRQHKHRLDTLEKQRLETNPMRILDSKNPELAEIIGGAPGLTEYLDPESTEHFEACKPA